ncbi:MAG TPA: hypothetical protein VHO70_11045 [Chitinispirillaceae bacterium]|nr:hypothetical protein [Chitinispirillaceae bacterium]
MKPLRDTHFTTTAAIPLLLLFFLYCQHFTNPFEDIDNADLRILPRTTFSCKVTDTLTIFSNDTLYLSAAVPELIDSFSVTISNNRDFPETTIVSPSAQVYAFRVSTYDAGNQVITIDIFRKGSPPSGRNILFYTKNPLHQIDLTGQNLDDSLTLNTIPVEDNSQVVYTWILDHIVVRSPFSHIKIKAYLMDNNEHTGHLYVSDSMYRSPEETFKFSFRDTIPPVILCLNPGYDNAIQTIRTPDTFIIFRVNVFDGNNQKAAYVKFNGEEPDAVSNLIYSRVIHNIKPFIESHPLTIAVQAVDKEFFGNVSNDTFKIIYDPSTVKRDTTLLTINKISTDSLTTSASPVIISGTLSNTSNKPVILKGLVNTTAVFTTPYPDGIGNWTCICNVISAFNDFVIEAYDTTNNLLARKSLIIFYDKRAVDTTPPVLLSLDIDGSESKKVYIHTDTAQVTIHAFDYGSGIQKVTIDNNDLLAAKSQYRWTWTIKDTVHAWKTIVVNITDEKSNIVSDTVQIMYNRYPSVTPPKLPFAIKTDTTYSGQLFPLDLDNDSLRIYILKNPANMVFSENYRQFTWTPDKSHTGYDTLSFFVFDGYEYSETYHFVYNVYDPLSTSASIKISDKQSIPSFLIAGKDTLRLKIQLGEPSGVPPYRFQTRILKSSGSLDFFSDDGSASWAPSPGDTGTCQLRIYVVDELMRSDTFITQFPVIPPNTDSADLVLKSIVNAKIIDSTSMVLNIDDSTCLLNFEIRDTDHPFTEKYHVTSTINNSTTSFNPSEKQFQLKVNGSMLKNDTVIITLKDSTRQNPDTLRFLVVSIIESPKLLSGLSRWYLPETFSYDFFSITWRDSSSSADNLTAYGDVYPVQNGLPGYSTVRFSSAYLSNAPKGNWMEDQFSIYIVARYDTLPSANTNQALISNYSVSTNNSYSLGLSPSGEIVAFYTEPRVPVVTTKSALFAQKYSWYVYSFTSEGSPANQPLTVTAGLNTTFTNITTTDKPNRSSTAIGINNTPGNKWAGEIAEIVHYNRNLTFMENRKVIEYLMRKYNLQ